MSPRYRLITSIVIPCLVFLCTAAPSALAQDITVTSAEPPSAGQGTVNLNVTIKGKGFKHGAQARFFVTTTADPGGIAVNSTTFVGGAELLANIDVAADATLANFDIEVQNANGRTGKGIELFAVTSGTAGDPSKSPVSISFRDSSSLPDRIQSDGLGPYTNGTDGVRAELVGTGNVTMDTDDTSAPIVRRLFLDFTDPATTVADPPFSTSTVVAFLSTSYCQNEGGLRDMAIGASQLCNLNVNFPAANKGWFIRFGTYSGTTPASVRRIDADTWEVEVPPPAIAKLLSYPTKGRFVLTDRGDFHMPVLLTVTRP
jgi:hypothetical protein